MVNRQKYGGSLRKTVRGLVVGAVDRQRDAPSRTSHLGGDAAASGAVPGAFRRRGGAAQGVGDLTIHTEIDVENLHFGHHCPMETVDPMGMVNLGGIKWICLIFSSILDA